MSYIQQYGVAIYKEYENIDPNSEFPFEIRTIKGTVIFEDNLFIKVQDDHGRIKEINRNDLVRFKPKYRKEGGDAQ